MKTKSNLLLFLVITTILLTSPFTSGTAFAENNDDKKNKKTFEQMCAKKKGNEPDALFCRAILGLQKSTDSFFDIFADLRLVDTHLQAQIDSFFDVFVELDLVADKQCPPGQVATGTNLDGSLLCTDITQNQDCGDGFYVSGIDADGKIKCKPLPSDSNSVCGDNIVTAPETCDDGNITSGDGCSATCSIEEQCTDGQPIAEQTTGDCREIQLCQEGQISIPDNSDIPSLPVSSCMQGACSDGVPSSIPLTSGTVCSVDGGFCDGAGICVAAEVCGDDTVTGSEQCDDGNITSGDGCNALCQVETGFSCVGNPSACSPICGDGVITGGEQCDGTDFGGLTCDDYGHSSGHLNCNSLSCTVNANSCFGPAL